MNAYQFFKKEYLQKNSYASAKEAWNFWKSLTNIEKARYNDGSNKKKLINKCIDIYKLSSAEKLKCQYLNYINKNINRNNTIPEKTNNLLRIATFNIHYFTDIWEQQDTYNDVLYAIIELNPDIIILQEAIIGGDVEINSSLNVDVSDLYNDLAEIGYKKFAMCNSVPSWFEAVYGNIILVKNDLLYICLQGKKNNDLFEEKRNKLVCETLDESIYTFSKAEEVAIVAGGQIGTKETRCYIYIKIPFQDRNLHIYGTHLDVGTEMTRANQIDEILKNINNKMKDDPTTFMDVFIILGDFNTIDPTDYEGTSKEKEIKANPFLKNNGAVIRILKNAGFIDANKNFKVSPELMTTWSNIRVDFIFIRDNQAINQGGITEDIIIGGGVYFTNSSDHIPVFVDLNLANSLKTKSKKNSNIY
jgi:endonuclease/exonuclease/phosphatase family metal-dependent hydrolase